MPRRDRYLMLGLALLSAAGLLAEGAGLIEPGLLYLAPLLMLLLPLLAGRYVGEGRIARLAATLREPRRPVGRGTAPPAVRRVAAALPRGGRLIAASLAVRPPPVVVAR